MAVASAVRNVDTATNEQHNLTLALPFCERTIRAPKPRPYAKQLSTLGDRLLAYGRDHGLTTRQIASRIGVTPQTLRNWERNRTKAEVRYYPEILTLVGDLALGPTQTLGARCRAERRKRGLSAERLAMLAGVDEATVLRLEADMPRMARGTITKILNHLEIPH